jgi:glutathione S-transferase
MSEPRPCTLYAETLWISPYVFSSFVALKEKAIPFEIVEIELFAGAHLKPDYRDASLTGRVPALDHAGFRLAESSAIAEYLEELYPARASLLPKALQERARARQLMAWFRSDLGALRDERSTVTMFYPFRLAPLARPAQRDAEKLIRVAEQTIPADGGDLFGSWCLADSELAFMLERLILNGDAVPPRVRAYAERQWQRPSVREFVEHSRPASVPEGYWRFTPRPTLA